MNARKPRRRNPRPDVRVLVAPLLLPLLCALFLATAFADVPDRPLPAGAAPNPGAQQQELPNITFPWPYNLFEFPITCMACHGGTIDQSAGHGSNWAGTNMASATRDPVFRANQVLVNNTLKNQGAGDGAGNMCFRCHSPNAWLSGRAEPTLGGSADGRDLIHSIVLSTDDEGISCEMCHRAIGAVTMQRWDLDPMDAVWNMMAGLDDWPHAGSPYPDGPTMDNPYGNATLQFHDGMSYGAKYGGIVELSFSDIPLDFPGSTLNYTGQTYGIYPWWYTGPMLPPPPGMPNTNAFGEVLQWNYDGSLSFHFEAGVTPDAWWGAVSPEHATRVSDFVLSPEFCGSCHEVTIPILNHGMPEQRTYTEWRYSDYGRPFDPDTGMPNPSIVRCQDCHMRTMKHEYADDAPVSLNPDPMVSGWYPYSKDRNIGGGTAFHKLAGANRVLPDMMKILYPELDLEVIGAPTNGDPRIFPGMLSDRGPMFDRARRNTEISLRDAVSVAIIDGPTLVDPAGRWQVTVQVTNHGGHKLPSGYPDGRRMWVGLVVKDAAGTVVYQSGHYDPASARLYTDAASPGLTRALTPAIDGAANAVMIYEKATCNDGDDDGACESLASSLINNKILFDNRIPPLGFTGADYSMNGAKFWSYDPTTLVPFEDFARYPDGQNWDEVTYTFDAPAGAALTARAEILYQSHTREFMDFLKDGIAALPAGDQGPRPEGPPSRLDPNYPLSPTYLSDSLTATTGVDFATLTDLDGAPLQDNWGGVAYASWLLTGQGAPYVMGAYDTAVAGPPAGAPVVTVVPGTNTTTGILDPVVQVIRWTPLADADGYLVRVRYGANPLTSDWDRLAVVLAPTLELRNEALNVGKTFVYTVTAFNAKGYGPESAEVIAQTPIDLPLTPLNTRVMSVTDTTATLTWYDQADNEEGFIIEWQPLPVDVNALFPNWALRAMVPSQTAGGAFGGNNWTDTGLEPGRTYNYRVSAYNAFGTSVPDLPVAATTLGLPPAPTALTATAISGLQVDLAWQDNSGGETGFRLERATTAGFTVITSVALPANATAFTDLTVVPGTTYYYRVFAFNAFGNSLPSNTATVTTPAQPPAAPSNLAATASLPSPNPPTVTVGWTDNAATEQGFTLQRATDLAFTAGLATFTLAANATSFLDSTVAPKVTYYYRVRAFNAAGFSFWSNTATVVTPGQIPETPAELRVLLASASTVTLAWLDNSTNELGFYVERSTDGGTTWTRIGTAAANTPRYRDARLARRTTYWYRVQAYNADGVSAYSNVAVAQTR